MFPVSPVTLVCIYLMLVVATCFEIRSISCCVFIFLRYKEMVSVHSSHLSSPIDLYPWLIDWEVVDDSQSEQQMSLKDEHEKNLVFQIWPLMNGWRSFENNNRFDQKTKPSWKLDFQVEITYQGITSTMSATLAYLKCLLGNQTFL